jgi:stage II sporulation protein AA (anti-sigma F factor antagonist)
MSELDGSGPDSHAPERPGALGSIEVVSDPDGTPVVRLRGEVDISNANDLGAELERIVGTGTRRLVVDMSALEFMDSSGIAMLLHAAARVDSISVRKPSKVVRRIIEATGLEAMLPIEG